MSTVMRLQVSAVLRYCAWLVGMSLSIANYGQLRDLSLEEAVAQRFTKFYPRGLSNLSWIPDTDTLVHNDSTHRHLLLRGYPFHRVDTLFSIDDAPFRELALQRMPRIHWLDNARLYFRHGYDIYLFDRRAKTLQLWNHYPSDENADLCTATGHIAFTRDNNLYIRLSSGDSVQVTQFRSADTVAGQAIARQEFGITKGTFWSPKGTALAFYQKDESQVTDYPLVDIKPRPAQLKSIKYPMAGQASERPAVGVYWLDSDTLVYLHTVGDPEHYLTNLTWDPDERYIYLVELNRGQDHLWLTRYDARTGALLDTLLEERHPKYVEPEHGPYFLEGRKGEFLWWSERDGYTHLYRYASDGTLLNRVSAGKWNVIDILRFHPEQGVVYLLGTDTSGLNNHLYRASVDSLAVEDLTVQEGMHRYRVNHDGRYIIDDYSAVDLPRAIQVVDYRGRSVHLLHLAADPYKGYKRPSIEIVEIPADDGTVLYGRLIKPYDFNPKKKYPVLVYVYGGPHVQLIQNRYMAGAPPWMLSLANKGYLVWSLDNRGSARRGLAFENVIHRQLGTVEMQDQLTGVAFLKSRPYVDTARMAVHGWSFGGFMTLTLMLRSPGTFRVGVAGGPVTDWAYYEVMYGERYMDTPQENPDGYQRARLHNYVQNLDGHLLIIHGSVDPIVVPQHSLTLLQAFIHHGKQVDFFLYPGHEHNVYGPDRVHLIQKIVDYIDQYIHPCKTQSTADE